MADLGKRTERRLKALVASWPRGDERIGPTEETVALVAQERSIAQDRLAVLEALELRLSTQKRPRIDEQKNRSNVIPLRRRAIEAASFSAQALAAQPAPLIAQPVLLISPDERQARRAALDAHELAQRWAFIDGSEVDAEIFLNREKWQELSGITIYLPDLASLSIEAQLRLAERLRGVSPGCGPLLLARASCAPEDLLRSGRSIAYLLDAFALAL